MPNSPLKNLDRINLHPIEMTPDIMQMLEDKGLIFRLYPGHHAVDVKEGDILEPTLYDGDQRFGPHKLIALTMNRHIFDSFGYHPDNEEFLLIGNPDTKPLYLLVALCMKTDLEAKINNKELTDEDFITLQLKYNDPEVSFFTMRKYVPHGEAVGFSDAHPPSFYVTRSDGFDVELINMGSYEFRLLS